MRKLVFAVVALTALALVGNASAKEEKYVAGGFEASGHVYTAIGFDYIGKDSAFAGGSAALSRDQWSNLRFADKAKNFGFWLDEAELDISKTFGENIKARVDLDFGDQSIGSFRNGINIEQAYVTANIPVGNGLEVLVGRFDAPIGYESVDRGENNTVTRSMLYNFGLRPWELTGLKLYYAFSDAVDWHIYAVNNLEDNMNANWNTDNSPMPSFGTRLGYTWGQEGTQSTIGLSAAFGPEYKCKTCATLPTTKLGRMSYLVDLDWNIWATDAFVIGGEGLFRVDDKAKADAPGKAAKFFGGILDLNYVFSDVWDGTLKYSILWQNNAAGSVLGNQGTFPLYAPQVLSKALFNEISLAGGYQITDGAKLKAEYRLDYTKYKGVVKNLSHSVIGMFAYEF